MIKENMGATILNFLAKYCQLSTKKRGHAPSTREKEGGKCLQIDKNNMSMAM
jgi:hypothetical protein